MKKASSNFKIWLDSIYGNQVSLAKSSIVVGTFLYYVGLVFYIAGSIAAPWPEQVLPWKMLAAASCYISVCLQTLVALPIFIPVSAPARVRVLRGFIAPALALVEIFAYRLVFGDMYPPIWLDYTVIVASVVMSLLRQLRILRI